MRNTIRAVLALAAVSSVVATTQVFADEAQQPPATVSRAAQSDGDRDSRRDQDTRVIEQVLVTAQRRQEALQDVPISITAVSGKDLERSSLGGVTEALKTIPGVTTLGDRNGIGSQIVMRGVPTGFFFSGAPTIAYYLDAAPMGLVRSSLGPDAGIYDLQRIEALRGPQGTLYGASAQAGVVRVLTNEPELDRSDFKVRTLASSTEHGGENYRGDAALNVPIIKDKLAARLVVGYQDNSGWIDRPGDSNANDAQNMNARIKIKAQPTNALTLDASAWVVRSDLGAPTSGDDDLRHASTFPEPSSTDYEIYTGRVTYDLGFAELTSSSTYLDFEAGNTLDYRPFCCQALQVTEFDSHIFVQDVALASNGEGPWRWSMGLFYRDGKDRTIQIFPPDFTPTGFDDTSESIAFFGEVTRSFADGKFDLTGGLRYFEDEVTTRDLAPTGTYVDDAKFDAVSPRVVLTWHVDEEAIIYASYGKGFRSGALQTPRPGALGFPATRPENLYNYELGTKANLFSGRLAAETAVYYMEREGIQQTLLVPVPAGLGGTTVAAAFVNGPGASGYGVDFTLTLSPTDFVSLGVNGSINDLEFDENVVTGSNILARKGERTNSSPATTLGAFANVDFPLGGGFDGALAGSVNYRSEIITNTVAFGALKSDSLLTGRISFSIRAPKNWEGSIFVDNVTDENGIVAADGFLISSWDIRLAPRTFGLQIEHRL